MMCEHNAVGRCCRVHLVGLPEAWRGRNNCHSQCGDSRGEIGQQSAIGGIDHALDGDSHGFQVGNSLTIFL
jgi:hypothetical protein